MPPVTRPVVVFVTHHLPWPACSGGRVREAQLLQRLSVHFDVEVVAVSKVPEFDRSHVVEATCHGVRARVFAAVDCGDTSLGPLTRRHGTSAARKYLAHRLSDPQVVVHVEGHYLLRLLPKHVRHAALLVEHNVESVLFEQQAAQNPVPTQRAALLQDGALTRRDELAAWREVRTVGAVTEEDAEAIRAAAPNADVRCMPNGADHLSGRSRTVDAARRRSAHLLFVAALGYGPNVTAARFLVADIFPEILSRCPNATLAIVGSDPPGWLVDSARREPHLTVTGWVPDVARWLDAAQVVVCPLTVGGGVKVKVLEALARGCAIVATPIALQGLRHLLPDAVVECADLSAFADACVRLLGSPSEQERQRARAAQAARYLPSWDLAADVVADAWTEMAAIAASTAAQA
jgi:polysaccharide biosynthesis protein PslH